MSICTPEVGNMVERSIIDTLGYYAYLSSLQNKLVEDELQVWFQIFNNRMEN